MNLVSVTGHNLANIFVVFHENLLFSETVKAQMHRRYVDETLCLFENTSEAKIFFSLHNVRYPALMYAMEIETNSIIYILGCFDN